MTLFEINLFGIELKASYYGLMYALGFLIGYIFLLKRDVLSKKQLDDLFLYIFGGVILGGRLGYILFYNASYYLSHPIDIIKFWEGGMSFHGGVLGVIIAMYLFSKFHKESFLKVADEITLVVPIGLFLGRIGNYLNGELLGYAGYTGPFAVVKNGISYFPSPLLEAFLEGVVLFTLLLYFSYKKKIKTGQIASLFLISYAIFRIFVEVFFRTPDPQIGYMFGFLTMGTLLSSFMFIAGIISFNLVKK